jgi:hypothetical protein
MDMSFVSVVRLLISSLIQSLSLYFGNGKMMMLIGIPDSMGPVNIPSLLFVVGAHLQHAWMWIPLLGLERLLLGNLLPHRFRLQVI